MEALVAETFTDRIQKGLACLRDPLLMVDSEGHTFFANPAALEILEHKGARNLTIQRLIMEALVQRIERHIEISLRIGRSSKTFFLHLSPILSSTADFLGLVLNFRDISRFKQTADELSDRLLVYEGYRRATELFDIVSETDLRGRILFVNDRYCELSKYARHRILGHDYRVLNSRLQSRAFFQELWSTVLEGRVWSGEVQNRASDGSIFWVHAVVAPIKDKRGRIRRFLSVGRDITQQKMIEQSLRESEHRFRELFDNVDLLAIGLSLEGRVTFINKYFSELTGWRHEEVLGLDWVTSFVPLSEREKMHRSFSKVLDEECGHVDESSEVTTKTGDRRSINWHWTKFKDTLGQVVGFAAIGEDFTDRKANEQRLRDLRTQVEENREEVVAFISHEVRSPLMGLLAGLENIEEKYPSAQMEVRSLRDQVNRIEKVSRDLLDSFIYRSGELHFEFKPTLMNCLLTRLVDRFKAMNLHRHNFRIELILPETEVRGEWDEDRLDQALSNIISNAVKYSKPDGGLVTVKLISMPETQSCRIEVSDEGVGIPPENFETLFHLFCRGSNVKTSPTQGLGIGLKMARDIIRRQNGEIHFRSELNVGTTFTIDLTSKSDPNVEPPSVQYS